MARPTDALYSATADLEELIALEAGASHAVATRTVTDAGPLAVAALDLAPRDEVIVAAGTRREIVGAILDAGARPVFADVDAVLGSITVAAVGAALTDRTRAVLVQHEHGAPAPVAAVAALTHRYGIRVIEDATDAYLAVLPGGRRAGSVGDLGLFGFGRAASGDGGGFVVTDDDRLARRLLGLRNNPPAPAPAPTPSLLPTGRGRPSGAEARRLLDRLQRAAIELTARRSAARRLAAALRPLPGLVLPPDLDHHALAAFPLLIDPAQVGVTNATYAAELAAAGGPVLTRHQRQPLYRVPRRAHARPARQPAYGPGRCPVAEDRVARTLVLLDWAPTGPADVDAVARAISQVHGDLTRRRFARGRG